MDRIRVQVGAVVTRYGVAIVAGLLGAVAAAGIISSTFNDLAAAAPVEIPTALQLPALALVGLLLGLAMRDVPRIGIALGITVFLSAMTIGVMLAAPGFNPGNYTVPRFNHALTQAVFALFLAAAFGAIGAVIAILVNAYVRNIDIDAMGVNDDHAPPGWSRRPVRDQDGERP